MLAELVQTTTSDHMTLYGAWHRTATHPSSTIPLDGVLMLHGVGGNFYNSHLLATLAGQLVIHGVQVLRVNTRGHDFVSLTRSKMGPQRQGATYETVDQCRHDIDAWIAFLVERGCHHVGVVGHSLGAIKAVYATAYQPHAATRLVVAMSPPALSYRRFLDGPRRKLFEKTMRRAQQHVDEGKPEAIIRTKYPFPLLITAAGYIEKYGPAERYNILRFANRLPCPTLFTYGQRELESGSVAFADLPDALAALNYDDHVPQCVTISGADHRYTDLEHQLADKVIGWLKNVKIADNR